MPARADRGARLRLITVAMMRPGAKLASYRLLAAALARISLHDWELVVVGDGAARAEVEAAFARFDPRRMRFVGFQTRRAWPHGCATATSLSGPRSTRPSAWPSSRRRRAACRSSPATPAASAPWWPPAARACWCRWATPTAFAAATRRLLTDTALRQRMAREALGVRPRGARPAGGRRADRCGAARCHGPARSPLRRRRRSGGIADDRRLSSPRQHGVERAGPHAGPPRHSVERARPRRGARLAPARRPGGPLGRIRCSGIRARCGARSRRRRSCPARRRGSEPALIEMDWGEWEGFGLDELRGRLRRRVRAQRGRRTGFPAAGRREPARRARARRALARRRRGARPSPWLPSRTRACCGPCSPPPPAGT